MARTRGDKGGASRRLPEAYGRALVRHRWAVLLVSLAATLVLGAGVRRLTVDAEYRVWFDPDNPELRAFEAVQRVYTRNDSILFVVSPKAGDVFQPGVLAAVRALTRAAWSLPFSRRVDSVTNFQHTTAQGDALTVSDLVPDSAAMTPAALAQVRKTALAEPALVGLLVAHDGRATGVNVVLAFPGKHGDERVRAARAARVLRDRIVAEYPAVEIRLTGLAMLDVAFYEAANRDAATLTPIMIALIAVAVMVLLRSLAAGLAALSVIVLATLAAMGAAGWAGVVVTPATAVAPTIIMTVAVADAVHLLSSVLHEMRAGAARHAAVVEGLRLNLWPMVLTSLTTAVGFLSLNFSDAPPFRDLGNVAALGVMVALGLSVGFLPALAAGVPLRGRPAARPGRPRFARLSEAVIRHRRGLLWSMGLLAAALAAMTVRVRLDDQFVRYFDRSIPFRADTDYASAHLTGLATLEYSLGAQGEGGIADPGYLRQLDAFARWLRAQPEVVHVSTLSDTVRRIDRSLHGDDPSWYRIPDSRTLAAQYLLLYELSLPFGLDLNDRINLDKSATRIVVTLRQMSQAHLRAMAERTDAWVAGHLPPYMTARATGPSIMFSHVSERNIKAMLSGTLVAFAGISALLVLAFRSWRIGLISLLPNLAPAAMAFGVWGLVVGQVGMAVSVVAAVSLGIVVDDTIHFISRYVRARDEQRADPEDAVRYAFASVGPAMATTTLVLVVGFLVLALSPFAVNADMGLLTALALAFALLLDFLLLPPALIALERTPRDAALEAEAG